MIRGEVFDQFFDNFYKTSCRRKECRTRTLHGPAIGLRSHFECATCERTVLAFEITQIGKRRGEGKLISISCINTRHQRLDEILVCLTSQPAADERPQAFISVDSSGRQDE